MATYSSRARRGLPRVPAGDPWPPPSERADPAHVATTSVVVASLPAVRSFGPALRRGLPRAAGGEAWPPPSLSPDNTAAALVDSHVPAHEPKVRPGESHPPLRGAMLRQGLPRVSGGAPWPPEALAPSAQVAVATVGASAVPATATRTGLAPLPFTRSAWPGVAARAPRPLPEVPVRVGPFTRVQWVGAVVIGGVGLVAAAAMLVFFVRWFISLNAMEDFIRTYPGEYHLPTEAPVGLPGWIGWQHFLNVFLMVLIIRSGLRVRSEKKPDAYWSPRWKPSRKISLTLWFHQSLDILWLVNGVVFIVLLIATGQWMRIVPTSWEVVPNAMSAGLQYLSLDWPTENGWVNYNSLQQLAYSATVFVAAPLAALTGVRMSGIWPSKATTLSRLYPVEWARAIHFPVMIYFLIFIFVHVVLVFATGALRNLNHMYASHDAVNWTGFAIFASSLIVLAVAWIAARPLVLAPLARLFGTVSSR